MEAAINRGKAKVRKTRLSARDIQENCLRIQAALEKVKVGSTEWEVLSKELEHQQTILRKYKDAKWYITPKDWLVIGGVTTAFFFLIGLNREWPSAIKLGSIVLKMFPFKGI